MSRELPSLAEKRRILQLETLHDLAVALQEHRPESELVDELLQQVCSVLDPAAAVAVTRDPYGAPRAVASVGWPSASLEGAELLADPLSQDLLREEGSTLEGEGSLAGRSYRQLLAAPLLYRDHFLGFLALLDKEGRGATDPSFSDEDRRFLESVAALAAVSLDNVRHLERLEKENKALRERLREEPGGGRIIAHSPEMTRILDLVERVAPRTVNVLVRGESGTGKELVARLVHSRSGRSGTLVAVNCAAIPESLLESELFGIERGVATGVEARQGKFELADRGTLFLDEIGDMRPAVQAKLLRALQEREVVRVGGQKTIEVDVRVVTATHRELERLVREGSFRQDLYYRLKGVEVELPPLRERRGDIPHLMRFFAEEFCRQEGISVPPFRTEATTLLLAYDYPGNVRELRNLVESAVSLSEGEIDRELILSLIGSSSQPLPSPQLLDLATLERNHIGRILRLTDGNKSAASRILGIDRRTLARKGF